MVVMKTALKGLYVSRTNCSDNVITTCLSNLHQGGYVFAWVCLFVCAFVIKITEKIKDRF